MGLTCSRNSKGAEGWRGNTGNEAQKGWGGLTRGLAGKEFGFHRVGGAADGGYGVEERWDRTGLGKILLAVFAQEALISGRP